MSPTHAARADVVVVGAGFCGLSAAEALAAAGLDVVVLEARDRVGGRVEARRNGLGEAYDTGGQFFCVDMPEVMALARRHGTLVLTHVDGDPVAQPPLPPAELGRTYQASYAIRERMNAISPDDPAIAGLTVADWLARQPDSLAAKTSFISMIEGLWCMPVGEVPAWYLIDNDRRITNETPELQYFLRETLNSVAVQLAAARGDRLKLGTPATLIARADGGVEVTAGADIFAARAALVAVPPVMASRIAYEPALPPALAGSLKAWRSGTVVKALLRYKTPFWREQGHSGITLWRDVHGLFACDTSPDVAHAALTVFIGGPLALEWRGHGEAWLRDEVLSRLSAAHGETAATPLDVTFRDWTDDRWSGGGYSDLVMDTTARNAEALLREGAPPIYFACSEISPSYPGYVEGAIVAGRVAAEKIAVAVGAAGRRLAQSDRATSASGS